MCKLSLLRNKLMIAVSAPSKHGKSESTQMLVDLLYLELVTRRQGWTAEMFSTRTNTFGHYDLTSHRNKDSFVVFSYEGERKIAVITAGDSWVEPIIECYQQLVDPNDIRNSACPKVIQESYEVVVGCCHPNNNVKANLIDMANASGFELMETSPYFQSPSVSTVSAKTPVFIWDYLFANELLEIILARIGSLGKKSTSSKADSFSAQFTPLVFAMMEDFRKSKDGFGFDIRKTNRNGRKEQGLIFHGNDDYVKVFLSDDSSKAMRSSTLGLVFVHDKETSQINCFLEVVCDNGSKNLGQYKNLVTAIVPPTKWEKAHCKDRYLMRFTICETTDWLEAVVEARKFLEVHAKDFRSNVRKGLYI